MRQSPAFCLYLVAIYLYVLKYPHGEWSININSDLLADFGGTVAGFTTLGCFITFGDAGFVAGNSNSLNSSSESRVWKLCGGMFHFVHNHYI